MWDKVCWICFVKFLGRDQDEYFNRYLHQLGIAPTAANKAHMMKFRPMDDCEVHGVWVQGSEAVIIQWNISTTRSYIYIYIMLYVDGHFEL